MSLNGSLVLFLIPAEIWLVFVLHVSCYRLYPDFNFATSSELEESSER